MTKVDFIKKIQEKATIDIPQKDVADILSAITAVIEDAVKADDDVSIPGIGKFSVKTVPERKGKIMMGNRKGEEYIVPEHKEPKFKISKSFKNILTD
jgi:nucleoid DNA-binding protein